ncbi:MAG: hypothetical protein E5W06_23665, partial [Mesorhizobium sp.]
DLKLPVSLPRNLTSSRFAAGQSAGGVPIGMQPVGRYVALSTQLEEEMPCRDRRPANQLPDLWNSTLPPPSSRGVNFL